MPVAVSSARLAAAREPDRFEQEQAQFFERVRQAYLDRAACSAGRIHVLDGTRSIESLREEMAAILASLGDA